MLYLGIDQHKRQLTVNLRGEDGSVLLKRQVPCPPPRLLKCSIQTRAWRNHSTSATVLIRRLHGGRIPAAREPTRCVPWTWPLRPGVFLIMERLGAPRGDRIDSSRCRAPLRPSADVTLRSAGVHEGTG